MRIILFSSVLIFSLLFSWPVQATERFVGIIGGVNFADLSTKLSNGAELETHLHAVFGGGAILGYQLREKVYLQIEPKYLQKGGTILQEESEGDAVLTTPPDLIFRLSFIEMPILARITFGEKIKRYAFFGPTFGFLLAAELETEFDGQTFTADIKEATKNTDFGVLLGTGVSLPLGRGQLLIDGRYVAGFANLNKGGTIQFKRGSQIRQEEISTRDTLSTKGFQIMVGYTLPVGAKS